MGTIMIEEKSLLNLATWILFLAPQDIVIKRMRAMIKESINKNFVLKI